MLQKNKHLDGDEPSSIKPISDTDDVKKLNKNPILIISGVVIVVVLALLYVAGTRSAPTKLEANGEVVETNGVASSASTLDELEARGQQDTNNSSYPPIMMSENGSVPPAPLNSDPLADPFAPQPSQNGSVPPAPMAQQNGGTKPPPNPFEEFRREQAMKSLKAGYSAMETPSKTGLVTMNPNTQNQGMAQQLTPQQQQMKIMDGYVDKIMGIASPNATASTASVTDNSSANKQFLGEIPSYDYVAGKKTAQLNPFEVKTGTVIPAVLITGVNSELPGKMKAQISENVYDTATGKYLLIPQGSTLVGDYSSGVVYGQKRVLTAWNRIIFPDGKTLNIGNMNGADREGFSGFQDEVDNHYMRIFGSAFMMGAITGGIAYSAPQSNPNSTVQTPSDQMIASMIAQLGQVGIKMIQKNMNVAPTITVRAGYKFNVFVTKDMRLEPLKMKLR